MHWVLRIACAGCFIGHGAFGILTKVEWLRYFFVESIPPHLAYSLMPVIGTWDILMGILILIWPCPAILIWMTCWGTFTAFLRPLAGEADWEFVERAGNYGVPFAFLLLSGWFENQTGLFQKIKIRPPASSLRHFARLVLIGSTGFILIGHGALLALIKKDLFVYQLSMLGMTVPKEYLALIGTAEIGMGLAVFFLQPPLFLIFIFIWKIFTESVYPLSGFPFWEFIERFGSYGAPLALFYLTTAARKGKVNHVLS